MRVGLQAGGIREGSKERGHRREKEAHNGNPIVFPGVLWIDRRKRILTREDEGQTKSQAY